LERDLLRVGEVEVRCGELLLDKWTGNTSEQPSSQ